MENVMIPATAAAVTGHGNATGATPLDFFDPRHPACINYGTGLPHWQQKAKIIFMTMRLADSLPQSLLNQYKEDLARDADRQTFIDEYARNEFMAASLRTKISECLDKGYGECLMNHDAVRDAIEQVLLSLDGQVYDLFDYAIMPNHIHFLIRPFDELAVISRRFKGATSHEVNSLLGRQGKKLWQSESFDHLVRTSDDFTRISDYIRHNPDSLPPGSRIFRH